MERHDLPQMNQRLARRPIDPTRRLPIPYAQLVNPDGSANFAAIDGPKAVRGAANRDCGLCGQRMGRCDAPAADYAIVLSPPLPERESANPSGPP